MSFKLDRGLFQFEFTDRHAIIGVSVDGTAVDISHRYQQIARKLHPDSKHWQTEAQKQLAVQLFSRLVTHAYGKLSRPSQRDEDRIMLELIGKRLMPEADRLDFPNPLAQKLYQTSADFEGVYLEILGELNARQYEELEQSVEIINQISEVNLAYLIRKQLQTVRSAPPGAPAATPAHTPPSSNPAAKTPTAEAPKMSMTDGSLRRAEEYINLKDWNKAILELRDASNIDPKNSRAHALLGIAYLRQKQLTMAKVSIGKALQLNPKDPQALQAKQELDKLTNTTSNTGKAANNGKSGSGSSLFGGLFGGKK
jgi:tetratricopeptide (TPR) repeat protein